MLNMRRLVPGLLLTAGLPLSAAAQQEAARTAPPILEYVDDGPALPQVLATGPSAPGLSLGFGGVQVNVDGDGMNILGDAANEPSIAVDPTAPNRVVIGWRQFDTVNSNFRQAGNAYSDDGGRTWNNREVFTPGTFRSDPVLDAGPDGSIYYNSLQGNFTCDMFISNDGGQTWQGPIPAAGGDKQWQTIDHTGGVGDGHIYISWSTAAGCCGTRIFTRSTDGGQTYMNPIRIPNSPVWGTQTVTPDGDLFIVGWDGNDATVVRSTNAKHAGETPVFDQVRTVDLDGTVVVFTGPNPSGLGGQLWLHADRSGGPSDGNLYLVSTVDRPGADPADVMFSRSTDGGDTWSAPVRINDDAGNHWQWFGTMSVAPNGRIDVVWNDTRDSGNVRLSQLYYSSSEDGGQTWSPNVSLSPTWDSHIGWPNQNKIGDYYDMESDLLGASLAWSATLNGEQDVYFMRIGGYDCNGNGIDDASDLASGTSGDCNGNGIPDECDIAAGVLEDSNGDGIPDGCECYADCNADGEVNTLDVLCFLNLWNTGSLEADCNADGEVNTLDVLCFLNAWNGGC